MPAHPAAPATSDKAPSAISDLALDAVLSVQSVGASPEFAVTCPLQDRIDNSSASFAFVSVEMAALSV
jgi:hypothetical protein